MFHVQLKLISVPPSILGKTYKLLELISSARLQDTKSIYKNQMNFYTLAMNNTKTQFRKQLHL